MTDPVARLIHAELAESRRVLDAAMADAGFVAALGAIGRAMAKSLAAGGKVMLAGNGGSAADAQHIAGELLSRLNFDRAPLAAVALTTDSSVLTAVGNDYGYAHVFERQVRGLGRKGDVFVGISTSGRSKNILAALEAARALGVVTVGFGGEGGGDMVPLCDHLLAVPSRRTPMIQQIHIVAAHIVCGIVENSLFGGPKT
jgi:D-sedoheptulose 7-phosphate isomerase